MTVAGYRPSAVRFRDRHPGIIAHKLRESMGTGRPVRIELRNGAIRDAYVTSMTRDREINVAQLHEQASNLTVHLQDGTAIKLDEIRAVGEANESEG